MDATSYAVLSYPTTPDASETYTAVAVLNGTASVAGSIILPATAGISWNGGTTGDAGSITIGMNATSQTFTAKFDPGSYTTIALSHTGMGFSGSDPTLPSAVAFSGGGDNPTVDEIVAGILAASIPNSNTPGTVADCLNAARAQGFGRWTISGMNLNLYGADGMTIVRTFVLDNPDDARART